MATYLYRLGRTAYRRWPAFLAGWLVLVVASIALASAISQPTTDSFSLPDIPSQQAADLQAELFPDSANPLEEANVNVVVAAPEDAQITEEPYASAVGRLVEDLVDGPQMPAPDAIGNPVRTASMAEQAEAPPGPAAQTEAAAALAPVSADGRVGVIGFSFAVDTLADVRPSTQDAVEEAMAQARTSGLVVEANGQGMGEIAPPGGTAELVGVGVALVVLILTFGSLVSAGLPIVSAICGVGIGIAGITAATAFTDVPSSALILATMIGLAVGIDYSLFILARYRHELQFTHDRAEAVGIALGTAGSAVVFAGLTVLIALAALVVVRIPFLTSMGLAAAGAVLLAVLVALTLLPALLGMLKAKAFAGQVRRARPKLDDRGQVVNNGVRWARFVGGRPVVAALVTVVALSALAIPLKDLYLAFPTDSTAEPDSTRRKASDLLAATFGPGREAPLVLVVDGRDLPAPERSGAYQEIVDWASELDGVVGALDASLLVGASAEERARAPGTQVLLVPEFGPDDSRTKDLLLALRDGERDIEASTDTQVGITGLTALTTDVSDRLSDALPLYLAVVVGLAFLLLVVVFRSLLIPATATLGFLLSVLATLGVTVAVFQNGALGLVHHQPTVSFTPIFLIGVVFGLAMDYQVFLVTRMREAHVRGSSTREAVVDGFRSSARVVTAAAVIMTAVFSGFILEVDPVIKSIGFALAVAVVIDAFAVRMVLIPALMYLMGERAWSLPGWLERLLPDVDVEGERLGRPASPPEPAAPSPHAAA